MCVCVRVCARARMHYALNDTFFLMHFDSVDFCEYLRVACFSVINLLSALSLSKRFINFL